MPRRNTGGFLSTKEQATDANSANGIFTTQEAAGLTAAGSFPTGRWTPQRSLRFRSANNNFLNRIPTVSGSQTTWTMSMWFKRGNITYGGASSTTSLFGWTHTVSGQSGEIGFANSSISGIGDNLFFSQGASNYRATNAVFRDPAAWYHLVAVWDSTNAVDSLRCRIYVNGVLQTYALSNSITQNTTLNCNAAAVNLSIGANIPLGGSSRDFFDGYISEVNFIDGQALEPSNFGSTDAETGSWVPKRYTGTYGTNGFYLPFTDNSYQQYLLSNFASGTTATAPSGGTADAARTTDGSYVVSNTSTGSAFDLVKYDFGSIRQITAIAINSWYFTNNATSGAQILISDDDITYTTVLSTTLTSSAQSFSSTTPYSCRYIKLRHTSFGANGQGAIDSFLVYTNSITWDQSGKANPSPLDGFNIQFTNSALATYDWMTDVPGIAATSSQLDIGGVTRGNYCTLNPLSLAGNLALYKGNLSVYNTVSTDAHRNARGNMGMSTGKWYWEVAVNNSANVDILGLADDTTGNSSGLYIGGSGQSAGWGYSTATGSWYYGSQWTANSTAPPVFPSSGIIGIAYDADAGKLWFSSNGSWLATNNGQGNPANGVNPNLVWSGARNTIFYPAISIYYNSGLWEFNFGQRPFAYTPPVGFKTLNTTNLANPVIKRPNDHFDVKTYTGNGVALTVGNTQKQTSAVAINKSARFRSTASSYLTRTPSTAGNRQKYTWSGWVKRSALTSGGIFNLFSSGTTSPDYDGFRFNADTLQFYQGGAVSVNIITTRIFTDTSAWYHIILAVDTTQPSASNRVIIYVNGSRITSFSTTNYPAQNASAAINNTYPHAVAAGAVNATFSYPFDGYMAETNFVDGQQLTPSSFGVFDANNNWMPQSYTGTYGTNGFYIKGDTAISTATGAITTTSSNFDSYLKRSDNATGWASTSVSIVKYPLSYNFDATKYQSGSWVADFSFALPNEPNPNATPAFIVFNFTDGTIRQFFGTGGNIPSQNAFTTGQATVSNGRLAWDPVARTLSENTSTYGGTPSVNSTYTGKILSSIGVYGGYSGSNGTLGYNSLYQNKVFVFGTDSSSNGNNYTTYNLNLDSGSTYDSMLDSPADTVDSSGNVVGNYAVLDVNSKGANCTISNCGLFWSAATGVGTRPSAISTLSMTTGKWYFEQAPVGAEPSGTMAGIVDESVSMTSLGYPGQLAKSYGFLPGVGIYANGSSTAYGASVAVGDVVGIAFDADARTLTYYKNGVSLGVAATGIPTGNYYFVIGNNSGSNILYSNVNFGQQPFAYTPPAGFKALNTKNLKDVGSTKLPDTFGNFVNTPDLVWIKQRSGTNYHNLYDTVRGPRQAIQSNTTTAQQTFDSLQTFKPNGYDLSTYVDVNQSGSSFVSWVWNRGQTPGFDIVSYGGNGGTQTINHNLGQTPAFMIVKGLNSVANSWGDPTVYHKSVGNTQCLKLNLNSAAITGYNTAPWANTSPNSSNFTVTYQAGAGLNGLNDSFIAYLWAEVPGFSKFGSYTGNASADGPFVHLGFKPKFWMWKRTDAVGDWLIHDTSRALYNPSDNTLYANLSAAEAVGGGYPIDIISNGVKVRNSATYCNASGGTYIYAAFAENPFKYGNAR